MRTAEDKSGSLVSLIVARHLAGRCGQMRTGADNSGSWLSFLGRTFCGQVRIGADKSGSWVSLLGGGYLADTWGTA